MAEKLTIRKILHSLACVWIGWHHGLLVGHARRDALHRALGEIQIGFISIIVLFTARRLTCREWITDDRWARPLESNLWLILSEF